MKGPTPAMPKTKPSVSTIRDRIKELRRVPAGTLLHNPRNWRRHPPSQQAALRGVLAEIGFADALLAYETPQGLRLVDGHLRADIAKDQEVPVLVLDVTEAEAMKLLATLDPLAAMAQPDEDKLMALLQETQFETPAVNAMLEALANGERHPMPDFANGVNMPSQDDIDRRGQALAGQFTERDRINANEIVDLVCPECSKTFSIRAGDVLKKEVREGK